MVVVPVRLSVLEASRVRLLPSNPPGPTIRLPPKLREPELKLIAPPLTVSGPSCTTPSVMLTVPVVLRIVLRAVKLPPALTLMVALPLPLLEPMVSEPLVWVILEVDEVLPTVIVLVAPLPRLDIVMLPA